MKLLIASDIHGSAAFCEKLLARYQAEKPDKALLLGDILYHGPRNDLPENYDPKKVAELLDPIADQIIAVRGNCDAEVDQLMLKFPLMADYALVCADGIEITMTHGHIYNQDNPVPFCKDILLCGHTHVPLIEEHQDFVYLNPGSVAIPKKDSRYSYMIYEDKTFSFRDLLNGEVYLEYKHA